MLVAKEQREQGREDVGTYLDERLVTTSGTRTCCALNGLAMVWKLNLPKEVNTLKMITELQKRNIGKPMSWGGKQLRCSPHEVFWRVLPHSRMEVWQGWFLAERPSEDHDPAVNAAKRAVDAGIAPEGQWLPGMPALVAIARPPVRPRLSDARDGYRGRGAYDEVATISPASRPTIYHEELKQAREEVQQNARLYSQRDPSRGVSLSKRAQQGAKKSAKTARRSRSQKSRATRCGLKADRRRWRNMRSSWTSTRLRSQGKAKEDERKPKAGQEGGGCIRQRREKAQGRAKERWCGKKAKL